jgi:hypothetical protein
MVLDKAKKGFEFMKGGPLYTRPSHMSQGAAGNDQVEKRADAVELAKLLVKDLCDTSRQREYICRWL